MLFRSNKDLDNSPGSSYHPRLDHLHSTVVSNIWMVDDPRPDHFLLPDSQTRCITLPALANLDFCPESLYDINDIFHSVTLPALKKLSIICGGVTFRGSFTEDGPGPNRNLGISSMIHRSSASLVNIFFEGQHLSSTELIEILLQSPELEVLQCKSNDISDEHNFLKFLACDNNHLEPPGPVCPLLRYILVGTDLYPPEANELEALLDMIIFRWHVAKQMGRDLSIAVMYTVNRRSAFEGVEAKYAEIQRCMSEGLKIDFPPKFCSKDFTKCKYQMEHHQGRTSHIFV